MQSLQTLHAGTQATPDMGALINDAGCAMLCYAMLCYAMLCYAMLCYAVLYYAMLCHAMLCCVISRGLCSYLLGMDYQSYLNTGGAPEGQPGYNPGENSRGGLGGLGHCIAPPPQCKAGGRGHAPLMQTLEV